MSNLKINNWNKQLLATCKKYKKIIVTGPLRSGTTFMTNQLAEQLGYEPVYLENFYRHDEDLFMKILSSDGNKVIQCPTMVHLLHLLDLSNTLVIFLKRNLDDIAESKHRIHLDNQRNYYRGVNMDDDIFEKSKFLKSDIPNINFYDETSKIKIDVWDNFLSKKIKHKYNLDYDEIQKHFPEAWVNKKDRKDFLPRQTQSDVKSDLLINKNIDLFSTSSDDHFCQLFIDDGEGYSEKNSIRKRIFSGLNKISFNVEKFDQIKALRFDPINDYAIVEPIKIEVFNSDDSYEELEIIDYNGSEFKDSAKIIFEHKDSNIFLSTPLSNPLVIEIQFELEKLETTLKYLFEQSKIKYKPSGITPIAQPTSKTDLLLKKINGKINLQTGEIEYIKSVLSKIKTENKKRYDISMQEQPNLINDDDMLKLLKKDENISSKLDEIESNISEKQLTIKSLLDMTGVEIKSALDRINNTFEANEKNKKLIDDLRKAAIVLDKKNEVLKYQLSEQAKIDKIKSNEITKLSKQFEKLNSENIALKASSNLLAKNEKLSQTEIRKLIKDNLAEAHKTAMLKSKYDEVLADFEALKRKFSETLKQIDVEQAKNESLAEELKHYNDIKLQYDKLLGELNFLTGELQE